MSSVEPEKNCVARKRKVFEGWWKKFFNHADFENNMIVYDCIDLEKS